MLTFPYLVAFFGTHNRLVALGKRVAGRKYSAAEFTRLIRRQFPSANFSFKTHRDYAVDPDSIIVSGTFDSVDESVGLPSINITLNYHPEQDTYFVDLLNWTQLAFDISECVWHEVVHRNQYTQGRKLKPYKSTDPEQEYLGGQDEIEAYGFSIAAESFVFQKPFESCVMYGVYKTTFDTDLKIVLQLEKQVNSYLKQLEQVYEQAYNN